MYIIYMHVSHDLPHPLQSPQIIEADPPPPPSPSDERKETNCQVMRQLQCIFGHLLEGRVQFYIPRGFWRDFRYDSVINIRLLIMVN